MIADPLVVVGSQSKHSGEWARASRPAAVGKDLLELLSSAMYINPQSIFREYIQNAADSIDQARQARILDRSEPGRVSIELNGGSRTIKLRDNGLGLSNDEFEYRLMAVGASNKRGRSARGLRGIGRLAGLAYCQQLIFRSRSVEGTHVSEMKWDCRRLRHLIQDTDFTGALDDVVDQTVTTRRVEVLKVPEHFFEVEMIGVARLRNDLLLNSLALEEYLSEVAPVPFAPDFRYRDDINLALYPYLEAGSLEVRVNGALESIYRPHRNIIPLSGDKVDAFTDLEVIQIPAVEGPPAAIGWVLHHGYPGALPNGARVKGLRLRSGDIQIGGDDLLQEIFPEPRFNSWAVGEIHLLDKRLVPNGRRDHLEQNVHLSNLLNHMSLVARDISRRCRMSSVRRKSLRDFDRQRALIKSGLAILRQGSLDEADRARVLGQVEETLRLMENIAAQNFLDVESRDLFSGIVRSLRRSLGRVLREPSRNKALTTIPDSKRQAYQKVFALIYECSSNQLAAKVLVDKILAKLTLPGR